MAIDPAARHCGVHAVATVRRALERQPRVGNAEQRRGYFARLASADESGTTGARDVFVRQVMTHALAEGLQLPPIAPMQAIAESHHSLVLKLATKELGNHLFGDRPNRQPLDRWFAHIMVDELVARHQRNAEAGVADSTLAEAMQSVMTYNPFVFGASPAGIAFFASAVLDAHLTRFESPPNVAFRHASDLGLLTLMQDGHTDPRSIPLIAALTHCDPIPIGLRELTCFLHTATRFPTLYSALDRFVNSSAYNRTTLTEATEHDFPALYAYLTRAPA